MKCALLIFRLRVIFLAALLSPGLIGCASLKHYQSGECNSQAYVQSILVDYITSRYGSGAPVRLAVIPFSAPANLSRHSDQRPALTDSLAWKIQAGLLQSAELPIVEVLNRQDWPGKKEEFFTGNHGALAQARSAGYDMILVGLLEPATDIRIMTAHTKVIEVESGITLWYGQSRVRSLDDQINKIGSGLHLIDRQPNQLRYFEGLSADLADCIVKAILSENVEL